LLDEAAAEIGVDNPFSTPLIAFDSTLSAIPSRR
jgi:hypothetical protein